MIFRVPVLFLLFTSAVILDACSPKADSPTPTNTAGDPTGCNVTSIDAYILGNPDAIISTTTFLPDSAGYQRVSLLSQLGLAFRTRYRLQNGKVVEFTTSGTDGQTNSVTTITCSYDAAGRPALVTKAIGSGTLQIFSSNRYHYQSSSKYLRYDSTGVSIFGGLDTMAYFTNAAGQVTAEYRRQQTGARRVWWPQAWYTYTNGKLTKKEVNAGIASGDSTRIVAETYTYTPIVVPANVSRYISAVNQIAPDNFRGGVNFMAYAGYSYLNNDQLISVNAGNATTQVTQNPSYNAAGCLQQYTFQEMQPGANGYNYSSRLVFNY